jgi:hypothetical protein
MDYVLFYKETPAEIGKRHDPAAADAYWGGWNAYMGAMAHAGVMKGGNGLQPPETGTTLRIVDGVRQFADGTVQDGPFADTKEVLGGYVVIDVPDLDAALEWASRAPCAAAGSVEVRPVLPAPTA